MTLTLPFPQNLLLALSELNPTMFILAITAILLDLLTGFLFKGVLMHNVQSSIMRQGLVHKSWEVALIIAAALVDVALAVGMHVGIPQPMSTVTCGFIFLMEVASICENALENNPELANAPIIRYVSQAKAQGDEGASEPEGTPRHLSREGGDAR